ncbi:hypothetical protein ACJX0J_007198 [Zea mays]
MGPHVREFHIPLSWGMSVRLGPHVENSSVVEVRRKLETGQHNIGSDANKNNGGYLHYLRVYYFKENEIITQPSNMGPYQGLGLWAILSNLDIDSGLEPMSICGVYTKVEVVVPKINWDYWWLELLKRNTIMPFGLATSDDERTDFHIILFIIFRNNTAILNQ